MPKERIQIKKEKAKSRTRAWALGVNVDWPEEEQWEANRKLADKRNWAEGRAVDKRA